MTARSSHFPMIVPIALVSIWLSGLPALAAPAEKAVNFTSPLATAKTIQVTEVGWETQHGSSPGPLRQAGTATFRVERPDKFRMEFTESGHAKPVYYYISDGRTAVSYYDGEQILSQPANPAELPFPMMGLLNNMSGPGPVSTIRAVRGGKHILLVVRTLASTRTEYWFDPKTHLLIRNTMFMTRQGKTYEGMRTDYTGWILNKPLSPAVFRVPSPGTVHK